MSEAAVPTADSAARGVVTIVIPCFNEATRLDPEGIDELLRDATASVLLVDDGSTDDTRAVLRAIAQRNGGRVDVLALDENVGKAEAVRRGLSVAIDGGADFVAYLDADFATPSAEMGRILDVLRDSTRLKAALGARVALLGSDIERKPHRHYLGRLFATAASMILGVSVYDTQCGAKAFRVDDNLRAALQEPFRSRWAFDVELLDRLLSGMDDGAGRDAVDAIAEVPLRRWRDVRGSKLKAAGRCM